MSDETQASRLVASYPCIEEIEGFLHATKLLTGHVPTEVMRIVSEYRGRLDKGKIIPAPTRMRRKYDYRRGQKPRRRVG